MEKAYSYFHQNFTEAINSSRVDEKLKSNIPCYIYKICILIYQKRATEKRKFGTEKYIVFRYQHNDIPK